MKDGGEGRDAPLYRLAPAETCHRRDTRRPHRHSRRAKRPGQRCDVAPPGEPPGAAPSWVLLVVAPGGTDLDKPPFSPTPGAGGWLRLPITWVPLALESEMPFPVVPGGASPPEAPECATDPLTPEGPPTGPSFTWGCATSAVPGFVVTGLPPFGGTGCTAADSGGPALLGPQATRPRLASKASDSVAKLLRIGCYWACFMARSLDAKHHCAPAAWRGLSANLEGLVGTRRVGGQAREAGAAGISDNP